LSRKCRFCMMAGLWPAASILHAQERPLQVNGVFSTGFYSSYTHDDVNQKLSFVPVGAQFNITGYWMMPDFLSFTAQPELNYGPQASEAGFQGGNGIRFTTTFLRKRTFPLTFRYSNVQREDAYFGGLGQVSTYSLKNRSRDLGLTWEWRPEKRPQLFFDWDKSSSDSISGIDLIPDSHSHGNHVNLDSKYERWGWNFDGFAHRQQYQSELFAPLNVGTNTFHLDQAVTQYQADAQRGVWRGSNLHLTAGSQSTASQLFNQPIDLTTRYANANLQILQKRRWRGSLRAGYSSNLASQVLNQILTGLGGTGPGTVAPDPSIFTPLRQSISSLNFNGTTSVDLTKGIGVYASVDHSQLLASSQDAALNSSYSTASGGVTYAKRLSWASISGQYGRDLGKGSITGQSGTIRGQNYLATLQTGTPDRLQMDLSVHGSDQRVLNATGFTTRNFSTEGTVMRRVIRNLSGRIGGGWQSGGFKNSANEFRSNGYTGRASIEHPRVQISASFNQNLGNSLPIYNQLLGVPVGTVIVTPLAIIPSDFRGVSFTLHANPMRKLEISATWTRSRQHLDGILNNDFDILNILATYHFRRLQFDAGYIRFNQIFLGYPDTRRGRFYVRVSRAAQLL